MRCRRARACSRAAQARSLADGHGSEASSGIGRGSGPYRQPYASLTYPEESDPLAAYVDHRTESPDDDHRANDGNPRA